MTRKLKQLFAATVLAGALALPAAAFAQPQDKDDRPAQEQEGKERHPVIRDAIRDLERVRYNLDHKAASDFKGHKAEAIKNINEAIEHLKQALAVDAK